MTASDLMWYKSSYSNDTGGACVEVAMTWRKSSYSNSQNGNCVEVADGEGGAAIRDTQHRTHGHLTFPTCEWAAFLQEAKDGRL